MWPTLREMVTRDPWPRRRPPRPPQFVMGLTMLALAAIVAFISWL